MKKLTTLPIDAQEAQRNLLMHLNNFAENDWERLAWAFPRTATLLEMWFNSQKKVN